MKLSSLLGHLPMAVVIVAFTATVGHEEARIFHLNHTINGLKTEQHQQYSQVTQTTAENISLEHAIHKLSDEKTNLQVLVDGINHTEPQVRYITRTETVIKASSPTITFQAPPGHYTHFLDKDIPIAAFDVVDSQYKFTTFDLSFRSTLIVGKKTSEVLVQVASSADNQWHEVPSTLVVENTEQHYPRFDPQIHGGIGLSSSALEPQAVIAVPLFSLTDWLDIVAPGAGLSAHPTAELLVVGANVGKPLPLVDDLWIWTGPSIGEAGLPGVSVDLTTRF